MCVAKSSGLYSRSCLSYSKQRRTTMPSPARTINSIADFFHVQDDSSVRGFCVAQGCSGDGDSDEFQLCRFEYLFERGRMVGGQGGDGRVTASVGRCESRERKREVVRRKGELSLGLQPNVVTLVFLPAVRVVRPCARSAHPTGMQTMQWRFFDSHRVEVVADFLPDQFGIVGERI